MPDISYGPIALAPFTYGLIIEFSNLGILSVFDRARNPFGSVDLAASGPDAVLTADFRLTGVTDPAELPTGVLAFNKNHWDPCCCSPTILALGEYITSMLPPYRKPPEYAPGEAPEGPMGETIEFSSKSTVHVARCALDLKFDLTPAKPGDEVAIVVQMLVRGSTLATCKIGIDGKQAGTIPPELNLGVIIP